MAPRLASSVLVNALIRQAEQLGGFGVVLFKGDSTAGAILIVLSQRGQPFGMMERALQATGDYNWQLKEAQDTEKQQENNDLIRRKRSYDPDLWVLELDIPSPERFAAEMIASN